MNLNKKIMIVLSLFLMLLVFVGASSAADESEVLAVDESVEIDNNVLALDSSSEASNDTNAVENNRNILSVDNNDVESNANILKENTGSYAELAARIEATQEAGDKEITLDKNCIYTYDTGNTINIKVGGFTVEGNGATIDMAGSNIQTFHVTASDVTFKNLTIKNANSAYAGADANTGGAIYFVNFGTVENCIFTGNKAFNGGAVYFNDNGKVTNCNFVNNSAIAAGGAISMGSGTVTNCNFVNNSAIEFGGAINMGSGTVTNCNFINNSVADAAGGAVDFYDGEGTVTNCNFVNNSAIESGGAICFVSGGGSVTNCAFNNNHAGSGDAIFMIFNGVSIENNWWGSNNPNWEKIISSGQIPSVYAILNVTADPTEIDASENSTITTKFVWKGTNTDATNSLPKRNVKLSSDGTLTVTEGDVGLISEFSATSVGVYYVNATVDNETLGVNVKVNGNEPVTDTWYVNASAASGGDGKSPETAFNTLNDALTAAQDSNTIMIASGEYKGTDNTGLSIGKSLNFIKYGDGEAIFDAESQRQIWAVTATSVNITGLTFKNGKDYVGGGAIQFSNAPNSNINATFINNFAAVGGAIVFVNGGFSGNLTGTFINNSAYGGGALDIENGGFSGNLNAIFINNAAEYEGGAVRLTGDVSGSLTGIFINNTAEFDGGAFQIYNSGVVAVIQDSIFINNINTFKSVGDAGITAVNCWFGNNATNYNTKPEVDNVNMDNWLFLNGTAVPGELEIGDVSKVTFKLDSYNVTSTDVVPYDASKMDILLDLSQTLGELDKNATLIGEELSYTAKTKGNGSVTGKFETAEYTIYLNNTETPPAKKDLNWTFTVPAEIVAGENFTIKISPQYDTEPTGTVTMKIPGEDDVTKEISSTMKFPVTLNENSTITFVYSGDDNYNSKTDSINITVKPAPEPGKKNLTLDASADPITVGENATVIVTGFENATGNVSVKAGNGVYFAPIEDGTATVTVEGLNEGTTTAIVSYPGDDNYNAANTTVDIVVIPAPEPGKMNLTLDASADPITVGENVTIIVSGFEDAIGDVVARVMGGSLSAPIVDGVATFVVPGVTLNTTAVIYFAGDDNYNAASTSVDIVVIPAPVPGKMNLTLDASADPITVGENVTIVVSGFEDAIGDVVARVMGGSLSAPIVDGVATFVVPGVTLNTTAVIYFAGDDNYNAASTVLILLFMRMLH